MTPDWCCDMLYKAYLDCCDFVRKSEWVGIFKLFKRYKRSIFTQSNVELASTFMLEFTESVFIFIVNVLSRFTGLPTTKAWLIIHHGHLKYGLWINASVKSYLFWRWLAISDRISDHSTVLQILAIATLQITIFSLLIFLLVKSLKKEQCNLVKMITGFINDLTSDTFFPPPTINLKFKFKIA